MGKKSGNTIVKTTGDAREVRRSAAKLRKLAKRQRTSGMRKIKVEGEAQPIEVPAAAIELLADALEEIAKGRSVKVTVHEEEVSTQKAADILNVSRPFFIRLLDKGEMPFRVVGTHRRLLLSDVLKYKARSDAQAGRAYRALVAQGQELGLGY